LTRDASTQAAAAPLPFHGLRVLDASQGLAGPYCAMLLAQHGADVVKLEPPEGDWSRGVGRRHGEQTALSLAGNRGKRSLAIDMKRPGAGAVVRRIADRCDVVLESFRPGVAQRLGLGYEALAATNPRLVYVSVSGYGQEGPYAERPGTDTVLQAFAGMMVFNRDANGTPAKVGFLVVDMLTAMYAFQAVSVALYARLAGGPGRKLDVSLLQASAAFLGLKVIEAGIDGAEPKPLNAPAGVYRARDGWIAITLAKEEQFTALCNALGRPDLRADPRYRDFEQRGVHLGPLREALDAEIARQDAAHWIARISEAGGLVNPVNTIQDWLADPHVRATNAAPPVSLPGIGEFGFPRIPGASVPADDEPRGQWPGLGANGAQVLRDCGFPDDEIERLRGAGVLVEPASK